MGWSQLAVITMPHTFLAIWTPAACSFPGENARSWEALGEARPGSWVSLTLNVGYLFTAAPAKRSHCSLPWMRDISSPPPFLTFNVG